MRYPASTRAASEEERMVLPAESPALPAEIPATMRAAVLAGQGDIRVVRKPVREPGEGEVLIKVAMCGTCRSDLSRVYRPQVPRSPPYGTFTPGHAWTGPGAVGMMTVQACKALGADRVILVGTRQNRLDLGARLGADHVVNARDDDPVAAVKQLLGPRGADLVIECSGNVETPQQCIEM